MARQDFEPTITEKVARFFTLILLGFLRLFLAGSSFRLLTSALENLRGPRASRLP